MAVKDNRHTGKVTPACSQVTEAVGASAGRRGEDDVKGCQLSSGDSAGSGICRTSDLVAD